jgi:hypothetical protein
MVKQVLSSLRVTSRAKVEDSIMTCYSCHNSLPESCYHGFYGYPKIGERCRGFKLKGGDNEG